MQRNLPYRDKTRSIATSASLQHRDFACDILNRIPIVKPWSQVSAEMQYIYIGPDNA